MSQYCSGMPLRVHARHATMGAGWGLRPSRPQDVRTPCFPLFRAGLVAGLLVSAASVARAQAVDLDNLTVADINAAFDAGRLTSEQLVQLSPGAHRRLRRQGPSLHAIITLNPKALETARALDAERKAKGRRSPLHGIPVVLKDNFDTFDMPTTGGSVLLEGSVPPDDAFVVKKLRDAGAIILAKVNLSEFAVGGAFSSLGGQSRNPHDLTRTPSGSSGGVGVAIAAAYAHARPWHRHRRVDPRPGHRQRHRRAEAHARAAQPRRHHPAGADVRHGRADGAQRLRRGRRPRRDDGRRCGGRGHAEERGQVRDRLHEVPQRRRPQGRAHRHRPRLHGRRSRRGLGDRGVARRDAQGRRDDRRRAVSAKWLLDAKENFYTAVRWPEFPVQIATYLATLGPAYPEEPRGDDRARPAFHVHARRRRAAQSRPLDAVPARSWTAAR